VSIRSVADRTARRPCGARTIHPSCVWSKRECSGYLHWSGPRLYEWACGREPMEGGCPSSIARQGRRSRRRASNDGSADLRSSCARGYGATGPIRPRSYQGRHLALTRRACGGPPPRYRSRRPSAGAGSCRPVDGASGGPPCSASSAQPLWRYGNGAAGFASAPKARPPAPRAVRHFQPTRERPKPH